MALALDIMKGGVPAGMAKAVQGQVNGSVTAAGTTQGTATELTASNNVVATATADQGVRLPSVEIADEIDICNISGVAVRVYPPTSNQINGLPANTHMVLANNTSCKLKKFTATRWLGNLSA